MKACMVAALLGILPAAAEAQHSHGAPAPQPRPDAADERPPRQPAPDVPDRIVEIAVTPEGFVPSSVTVKRGQRVRLVVTRRTDDPKLGEFILDEFLVWLRLPLNERAGVSFTTDRTGAFPFRSKDGTATGVFNVE